MKKGITILLVLFFIAIGLSSAENTITLNGNVAEVDYVLSLFYGNNDITNSVSPYEIGTFDLQNDNQTENFTIYLSGNQSETNDFSVKVTASPFKLQNLQSGAVYVEGENQLAVGIETHNGSAITSGHLYTLQLNGYFDNFLLGGFRLKWNPNDATLLDAGDYVSDVIVEYNVNY